LKFRKQEWIHKWNSCSDRSRQILCVVGATIAFFGILCYQQRQVRVIENGEISRAESAEQVQELALDIYTQNHKEPYQANVEVQPRTYTQEEALQIFTEVYDKLLTQILGKNTSLSEVTSNLELPTQLDGYNLTLEWYSSDYELVDYDGTVYTDLLNDKERKPLTLTVKMESGEYMSENTIDICVTVPEYTEAEKANRHVSQAVRQAEEKKRNEATVQLPDTIAGEKVTYAYHENKTSPLLAIGFGIIGVIAIYMKEIEQKRKEATQRKQQLEYDYAEFISKLTVLVGAGMTIRRAWERIVCDYKEKGSTKKRVVYEEMSYTQTQLENGVAETVAYAQFGRRCNTKEYLKLATLLEQNIKKGSRDLLKLLDQEAYDAFAAHKDIARKKGEEAGTKLLIPMILMLLVVMAIVMTPAVLSMN